MNIRALLIIAMLTVIPLQAGTPVGAQGRMGTPGGPPMQTGMPAGFPGPGTIPERGSPNTGEGRSTAAQFGMERASAAQAPEVHLAKPEADRAADRMRASPGDYELDQNGALAISGEILASDLTATQLNRVKRAGFAVLRQSTIEGLGTTITVISRPGLSASQGLKLLRKIDPQGNYDLNHVLFESGLSQAGPTASAKTASLEGRGAVVGLIDSGVANTVDRAPNVRVTRRAFAPGGGTAALHGTAVAQLLARHSGRVTIFAADIFGIGPRGGTTEQLLQALGWLASERVPVINVSMVGPPNALVAGVVARFIDHGFIIVAPVGNDGATARLLYPASYPGVIAVSASGADGRLLPEASRVKRVDFVALGIATVFDAAGHATTVRGTSFAAPVISRELADRIAYPDPVLSRKATVGLRRSAVMPKADRPWFGSGLIAAAN